ncbi:DUF6378 domain-containing protein [Lachnoclostridium sp. Marseille-P6806]|uniref:DUF6378 domain-containing protein n=1 Tax=Lachnoclostridium sp. Marseille-P6806 TaxID=2364793 RepID=UPI00103054B4|nr:DUF6378 domain-containing protein [Lachnoclostridium sp. Marseille-P6806]
MTREEILNEAKKCVCTDRNEQYGEPEDNFKMIAALWNAYLKNIDLLDSQDVANMMILFKVARNATALDNPKPDNWIDIAGYAACGGECM